MVICFTRDGDCGCKVLLLHVVWLGFSFWVRLKELMRGLFVVVHWCLPLSSGWPTLLSSEPSEAELTSPDSSLSGESSLTPFQKREMKPCFLSAGLLKEPEGLVADLSVVGRVVETAYPSIIDYNNILDYKDFFLIFPLLVEVLL